MKFISKTQKSGELGETLALQYLQKHHLKLIQKNFSTKLGEIDLIMSDKNTLVFIEVRLRKKDSLQSPIESITLSKRKKIQHTAQYYLRLKKLNLSVPIRFDAICIEMDSLDQPTIQWMKNIF